MKKRYIKPQVEVVALNMHRNLLLVVSGTETEEQLSPELLIDDSDIAIALDDEGILQGL